MKFGWFVRKILQFKTYKKVFFEQFVDFWPRRAGDFTIRNFSSTLSSDIAKSSKNQLTIKLPRIFFSLKI